MDGNSIDRAMCCFCGKECDFHSAVQLALRPSYESDEAQHLCGHKACLRRVIHESVPLHPDFEDD